MRAATTELSSWPSANKQLTDLESGDVRARPLRVQ
jgi:hypothetical protein